MKFPFPKTYVYDRCCFTLKIYAENFEVFFYIIFRLPCYKNIFYLNNKSITFKTLQITIHKNYKIGVITIIIIAVIYICYYFLL